MIIFNYNFFLHKLILILRREDTLIFLLFFFLFLITLFLGVLFMNGENGSAPNPPSTNAGNDMGNSGGKPGNENNFSGFDTTSRENPSENKNKKAKHSHTPVNSSFSQFPTYIHSDLERRSQHSMFAKSSIARKKTELEIAKLKARIKPLSDKEGELCKSFSDKC